MSTSGGVFHGTERFAVVRRLGAGGMGEVYEVFDRDRGERVALKSLLQVDALGIQRFKHEFRALADLAHPNLVSLYELISVRDQWFFTMELLDGSNFLDYVRPIVAAAALTTPDVVARSDAHLAGGLRLRGPSIDGELWEDATSLANESVPTKEHTLTLGGAGPIFGAGGGEHVAAGAARVESGPRANPARQPAATGGRALDEVRLRRGLAQLATGLHALHVAGMLHRDIKPSNVLVTSEERVVLLDFGLVANVSDDGQHHTSRFLLVGTPPYMSPEQFDTGPLGPASDWYSVGLMLYETLTGVVPHTQRGPWMEIALARRSSEPASPRALWPGAPEDLSSLCMSLLRLDPRARPSGEEVLARLGPATATPQIFTPLTPVSPPAPPRSVELVGREASLARLQRALAEVQERNAVVLTVHGRSGMGKTALVQHFLDGLPRASAPVILRGRCFERESVPYKALDTLTESLVAHLRTLGESDVLRVLPREAFTLARVFPAFGRIEAVAAMPRLGAEIPDARELRRRAFAALRELLARIGDTALLVLHIDDLQWGDVDSGELLGQVLRGPDRPSLLLLLGCRSEDRAHSPFLDALLSERDGRIDALVGEIEVGPLELEAAARLARVLGPRLSPETAAAVARESGGSPFFVDELVRFVASRSGGEEALGQEALGQGRHTVKLEQLVGDRLLSLPGATRRLLEVIAVASRPLGETIAGVAADVGGSLRESLRELRRGNLIRGSLVGDTALVETFHDRIRETVLQQLDAFGTRAHHLRLARALEAAGGADPEMLAVHFGAAEEKQKAGEYARLAAELAARSLAFDRAVRLYRLAAELASDPASDTTSDGSDATSDNTSDTGAGDDRPSLLELRTALGDALTNAGRAAEAAEAYLSAASVGTAREAEERKGRAAAQLLLSGHIDQGMVVLRDVIAGARLKPPTTRRRALLSIVARRLWLRLRGNAFRRRDAAAIDPEVLRRIDTVWPVGLYLSSVDNVRGAWFQLTNLLLSLDAGEPFRVCRSLCVEAGYTSVAGHSAVAPAHRLLDKARALADELDQPYTNGLFTLAEGICAFMAEENWAKAGALCEKSEALFRERCRGVTWELSNSLFFALNSLLLRGKIALLRERLPSAIKWAQEHNDLFSESFLRLRFLSVVWLAGDEPDNAEDQHSIVVDRLSDGDFYLQHYWRLHAEVQIELYRGRPAIALEQFTQLWQNLRRSLLLRMQFHRIDARHLRARTMIAAAAATKNQSERAPLLAQAAADARAIERENTPRSRPLASLVRAALAQAGSDTATSQRLLAAAIAGFDAADMGLFAAATRRRRGALIGGDAGAALVAEGNAFFDAQGIRDRDRMTALFVPGF